MYKYEILNQKLAPVFNYVVNNVGNLDIQLPRAFRHNAASVTSLQLHQKDQNVQIEKFAFEVIYNRKTVN